MKTLEYSGGSLIATSQFVWPDKTRGEERNSGGSVTKQFFDPGEIVSGTSYFYTKDHLGSIREMTDGNPNIQAQYLYDSYGRSTKTQGSLAADFQYAGYYLHARSGFSLTLARAFNAELGRFINRDPIEEDGGLNLYAYVENDPISDVDPSGLQGDASNWTANESHGYASPTDFVSFEWPKLDVPIIIPPPDANFFPWLPPLSGHGHNTGPRPGRPKRMPDTLPCKPPPEPCEPPAYMPDTLSCVIWCFVNCFPKGIRQFGRCTARCRHLHKRH